MFQSSVTLRRSSRKRQPSASADNTTVYRKKQRKLAQLKSPKYDVILLDIEGTTTPIAFVHEVLFPHAKNELETYLTETYETAETQKDVLALIEQAKIDLKNKVPGAVLIPDIGFQAIQRNAVIANVLWQMSNDMKSTALKRLQGHIWKAGYKSGLLKGDLFPDVKSSLSQWHQQSIRLCIYSSGSIEAQKLLFGYSKEGDLTPMISQYFDTTSGDKRSPTSYSTIAEALSCPANRVIFLTDIYAEADAADQAGMTAVLLDRPGNHKDLGKGPKLLPRARTFPECDKYIFDE